MSVMDRFDIEKTDLIAGGLFVLAVLLLPWFITDRFFSNLLFFVFLYAGLASAWNLVGGYAGQFSLGHTAFFGIGAYASTLLYTIFGVSPWLGMVVGIGVSVLLAFLISYPVFRLRGVFFAMATIAMGETVRIVLLWGRGKINIPYSLSINYEPALQNMIFVENSHYALLAGIFLILVTLTCYGLTRSRIGYYMKALRDNEEAAQAAGVDLRRYKLISFLVSAAFTSVGGTLMAQYVLYIEPSTVFDITISIDFALMSILGGIGTLSGPILGAILALPLQEFLKDWLSVFGAGAHLVVYAVLLILIVMLLPEGVVGLFQKYSNKRKERQNA